MFRWLADQSLRRRANARNISLETLYGGPSTLPTHKTKLSKLHKQGRNVWLNHWSVKMKTKNLRKQSNM